MLDDDDDDVVVDDGGGGVGVDDVLYFADCQLAIV